MKGRFSINSYPVGIFSDCHTRMDNLAKILARHPEVKQWFCLGDIVDFIEFDGNRATMDEWISKYSNIPLIRGNHEEMVVKDMLAITFTHKRFLIEKLYTSLELLLPDKTRILCYHNKPECNWSFVDKNYTEREFIDTYLDIADDVKACAIGHSHSQYLLEFPNTFTQLWGVGAVKFGAYAIVDEGGIHHKQLDNSGIYAGNK